MKTQNGKWLKYKIGIPLLAVMLVSMSVWLAACGSLNNTPRTTDKPRQMWAGQRGETPDKVWDTYDWVIVDSDKYICVEK